MRLVSICVVLCMVPLGLLSYFTVHLANRAVVKEVDARVRTTSAVTAVLFGTQVQSVVAFTNSYASRTRLIAALADGDSANFDEAVINIQLDELAPPGSGGAFVADTACRVTQVWPSTPEVIGVDFSARDWCRGVLSSGGPYVSEAFRSGIAGHPLTIAIAMPVRAVVGDPSSKALAILAVLYPLDTIAGFADGLAKAQGLRLTVTDQRGTLLAGRSDQPSEPEGLVSATSDPRVREALAGRSGVTRTKGSDGDALSGYAPVPGIGWTVTAEVPTREALASVRQLRSTVLSVAGLLGLVMLAGVVLLARTFRQRREAERSLIEREANTRAILDAATDAFVSMDGHGVISAWNGQAEEIFGWTEAEAVGRNVFETVFPPEDRERYVSRWLDIQLAGDGVIESSRVELMAQHRDGHQFAAEAAVWPVHLGDRWGFNAFVHDISERKLIAADLATARDDALAASQLKSEFLANMSHEIRTPMNGVLGMTSLLLETDLGVEQREFAETVQASGEALLNILNDILDFSKIEAGRLDLESIDFDLRGLVEDVASMFSVPAHAKGLELACSVPVDMPAVVRGDPGRVRQIVTNLVGNAVKFTPSGEVVLQLTMTGGDDASPSMRFQVVDTGIGIAEADQEPMFESFSQADAGTTRRYGGTGLGLAISRQLVELMGGKIGVTSAVGHGSAFWFTLPLLRGGPVPAPAPRASLPGLRILVVDDNATNRDILTHFLQSWGVRSEAVDGAVAARRSIAAGTVAGDPFDAALLDLNMPDVDGIQLAEVIAADTSHPPMKLVLLTSSGQAGEAERAREAGITTYLTKPVRQSQLHDCLMTLLVAPPDPPPGVDGPVTASPRLARDGSSGRILLAEDNLVNQRVASVMLVNLGYDVDIVENGALAVAAATATRYRAILMDCQMPVLDGFDATAQIRSLHGESSRTPIVAVTASAMKSDVQHCLDAGMDDYLSKPVRLKALATVMARWAPDSSEPPKAPETATLVAAAVTVHEA
jgi:PAS domain S-box-containing protein